MHIKRRRHETPKLMTMRARSRSRWRCALFAGIFLLTQLALAAQGCALSFDRVADAHEQAMADEQCGSPPMAGAACLLHCLGQDQSASAPDQHLNAIAPSAASRPLDFTRAAMRAPLHVPCDSRLHVPRTPQILYCSYQT